MAAELLPDDVRKLVTEYITSVEQVEILLLLRARGGDELTAEEISEELRTTERSCETRVVGLIEAGLVARVSESDVVRYRFAPKNEWLSRATAQLARAYEERRHAVIDFIFSKPIDRLRVYADAFRFRREPS